MITMNVSGNITADAIERNVNGTIVLNFSVASNHRYKTSAGEVKEETTFMNCQLWNPKGEVSKLLYKGRGINVMGYFKVREYVGTDGVLRTAYNVRVSSFQLYGKNRPDGSNTVIVPDAEPLINIPETDKPPMEDVIDDLPF